MNRAIYCLTLFSILLSGSLIAQEPDENILLTGVVLSGDPLVPVPNTNIIISNKHKGTASDDKGYFSFYTAANDTILFSAVGFKGGQYVIPEDLNQSHYSIVQIMTNDTIWLQETIIFPWKDYDTFGEELVMMAPPVTDDVRAKMNLESAKLYEKSITIHMDGSANFKHQQKIHADKMYYGGQVPPQQIFNPFAWANFIKSVQNGDYKR